MTLNRVFFFFVICMTLILQSCGDDDPVVVYDPSPYELSFGDFPPPVLQPDNLPTQAGVQLGRMLFYEKKIVPRQYTSLRGLPSTEGYVL